MKPQLNQVRAGSAPALLTIVLLVSQFSFDGWAQTVSYYRLRFELTTTSSAAQLTIKDLTHILSGRQMSVSGTPKKAGITLQRLWVASSAAGESVAVSGDYAISPEALLQPLPCQLVNSTDGISCLRLYTIFADGDSLLLFDVPPVSIDTLSFAIDLDTLQVVPPLQKTLTTAAAQKLLCAFYYPWYDLDAWNSRILLDHPATRYSSDDSTAINLHIRQAQSAGIDVFLSSWWGPDSYTDSNLILLLRLAQSRNFQVAINFETLTTDPITQEVIPLPDAEILTWLEYAITNYGDHPSYLKVDNKPVFVLWASTTVADTSWQNIFEQLKMTDREAAYIAMFNSEDPALNEFEIFDGLHTYNILSVIQSNQQVPTVLSQTYQHLGSAQRYYPLLAETTDSKIWAATAQPGYDDHLIPGRTSPILPRENGDLYRNTFFAAINSDPDLIFITTWNEWWEHTYIEPSENFGDQYLQLTQELAEQWKGYPVQVEQKEIHIIDHFSLKQNYPNPFNPGTTIKFTLPKSAFVTLKVYNLLGEEVAALVEEQRTAGIHKLSWDAGGLASGVYVYRLNAGDYEQTRKLILLR